MAARDVGRELAEGARVCLTAPAGYGKTHSIASAVKVAAETQGRQLILTHTHAGVHALQEKLAKLSVPRRHWHVETIAGWALKYAAAFPRASGLETGMPTGKGWDAVYPAALACLGVPSVRDVLVSSFAGIFVDEYQDCTSAQHALVLKLAELLPCRLLGDPMQGIFDFTGPTVDMERDLGDFVALEPLDTPYRWLNAGKPELAEWLAAARRTIMGGAALKISPPAERVGTDRGDLQAHCKALIGKGGSVVVEHQFANQAHSFAKSVSGRYHSMEEMECGDLSALAAKLDETDPAGQALALLEHYGGSVSNVSGVCGPIASAVRAGSYSASRYRANRALADSIAEVVSGGGPAALAKAARQIAALDGAVLYRRELNRETLRAFAAMSTGGYASYAEAAFEIRERTRRLGRPAERLSSSRVLLVKGLEFRHAVVAVADTLKPRELYVALTRGSDSLSVQCEGPFIQPLEAKRKPEVAPPAAGPVAQPSLF